MVTSLASRASLSLRSGITSAKVNGDWIDTYEYNFSQKSPSTLLPAKRDHARKDSQRRMGAGQLDSVRARTGGAVRDQPHDRTPGDYRAGQRRAILPRAGQGYFCEPSQDHAA